MKYCIICYCFRANDAREKGKTRLRGVVAHRGLVALSEFWACHFGSRWGVISGLDICLPCLRSKCCYFGWRRIVLQAGLVSLPAATHLSVCERVFRALKTFRSSVVCAVYYPEVGLWGPPSRWAEAGPSHSYCSPTEITENHEKEGHQSVT